MASMNALVDESDLEIDQAVLSALRTNPRDRLTILKLDQELERFINDPTRSRMDFKPMSSYQRLLVHRVAQHFKLDHVVVDVEPGGAKRAIVLYKSASCRIPLIRFSDLIASAPEVEAPATVPDTPAPSAAPPAAASAPVKPLKIMKRSDSGPQQQQSQSRPNSQPSSMPDSPATQPVKAQMQSPPQQQVLHNAQKPAAVSVKAPTTHIPVAVYTPPAVTVQTPATTTTATTAAMTAQQPQALSQPTLEQREEEYAKARARIFGPENDSTLQQAEALKDTVTSKVKARSAFSPEEIAEYTRHPVVVPTEADAWGRLWSPAGAAASFDQQAAFYPYEYYPVFPAYVAQPPMVQQPTMASPEDFPPLPSAYGSNLHGQGLLGEQPAALLPFPVVHPVVEELSEEMAGVMAQPEIAFGTNNGAPYQVPYALYPNAAPVGVPAPFFYDAYARPPTLKPKELFDPNAPGKGRTVSDPVAMPSSLPLPTPQMPMQAPIPKNIRYSSSGVVEHSTEILSNTSLARSPSHESFFTPTVQSMNKPPSVPPGTISEPHLQAMSHILQVSNLAGTPTQHCNTLLEEMRQLGASIKSVDRNSCLAIFPNSDAATVCRLKVSGTCAPLVVGPWTIRVNNNGPPLLPPRGPALSTDSSPQWSPAPPVAAFRQLDLKGS